MLRAYFFTLGLLLALTVAGCASDSYLARLGRALVDKAPAAAEAASNNPTPIGIITAIVGWVGGSLGVAGTGAAVTMHVRKRRRRAAALRLASTDDPLIPPSPALTSALQPPPTE